MLLFPLLFCWVPFLFEPYLVYVGRGKGCFFFSQAANDLVEVRMLLDDGADVHGADYDQRTALHLAPGPRPIFFPKDGKCGNERPLT